MVRGVGKKILIILLSSLLVVLIGAGSYLVLEMTVFARKKVPPLVGLSVKEAKSTVEMAGLTLSAVYKRQFRTGKELVTSQKPTVGIVLKRGAKVTVTFEDPEFESAYNQAAGAVGQANNALQEVQGMGIDTADLVEPIKAAQARLDGANSVEQLIGQSDSAAYWAGTVINACNAKKQARAAQGERDRQVAACKAAMMSYAKANSSNVIIKGFSSFSINPDYTYATGVMIGVYGPGQPWSGQQLEPVTITAVRRGDSWVVTSFGTG